MILNKDQHRGLRMQGEDARFGFARETNSVPLVGAEFAACAGHYPIVFADVTGDLPMPSALLGGRDRENLFVDDEGRWDAGYVPAFVRRYPFVLAGSAAEGGFSVCFDEAFEGLSAEGDGTALFEDDGEPAAFLRGVMDFLRDYQAQAEATRAFVERLLEYELLIERRLEVQRSDGDRLSLSGFRVVDEKRLSALDDAQVLALFRSGGLSWIEAHRVSLERVAGLNARLDRFGEGASAGS